MEGIRSQLEEKSRFGSSSTVLEEEEEESAQTRATSAEETNQLEERLECGSHKETSRRNSELATGSSEAEWSANKVIDFDLKYTWLASQEALRRAIRKAGVPSEVRPRVWLRLIEQTVGASYNALSLLRAAGATIVEERADEETQTILKQIELDINRTMPGHKLFDEGAEGGVKLRRILVAYSVHVNKAIAYCQGFNFIVALLLSVFEGDEEKALRGFICIVDHIFPSKFYFDHYLTGARADQFLLADFICDQLIKNPGTAERKIIEDVTSSITLNWFISLFHGAVPASTRLTILDHFMLDGVKALFRFTMAILYLAFQVTPPSSCDVFATIRDTAKELYDVKLLLSIVEQIKLPKDSYFAIRRSFYMVQASFNSDQFYMQSLSNEASRQFVSNKPLSVQQLPDTKPPSMSFISAASLVAHQSFGFSNESSRHSSANNANNPASPRVCTSSNRTKVCIQNMGKLGRSHIRIMDANVRSNERSLMSPLRNCIVIGVSNCGKIVIVARQSSKRNLKTFREQDLTFHVHEVCTEIFEGFYLEDCKLAFVITYSGEILKINTTKCLTDTLAGSTETLMLKESHPFAESEKVKLRLASIDVCTNLLWVYVECEDSASTSQQQGNSLRSRRCSLEEKSLQFEQLAETEPRSRSNNPFLCDSDEASIESQVRVNNNNHHQRKILIIDIITFDVFSAFTVHPSFGDITKLRTSLVAFCQLANPMSNQFSSRIVRIGPTGRYEHLLSFSDVVDFMITVSDTFGLKPEVTESKSSKRSTISQTYSSLNRLITRSISLNYDNGAQESAEKQKCDTAGSQSGTLTSYYRSLIKSHSTATDTPSRFVRPVEAKSARSESQDVSCTDQLGKTLSEQSSRAIISSYLGDVEDVVERNYIPVIMTFIFRNGKIAIFEFTESYAIHTRESQLDRYDYSRVIDVTKNGAEFIITILTIFDKVIKVVI